MLPIRHKQTMQKCYLHDKMDTSNALLIPWHILSAAFNT